MASTYSTSLGIEKMATGDQSGAWGTTSNHNWDILDRITSYTSVAITTNADTATLTVREASPGSGTENLQDGMYRVIKFTGALDSNCTVTIAPNTAKVFFIIINATTDSGSSGPYSIILSQGSGANVTVQNGNNAVIYCDGAGSGAVVTDALSDLQIGNDLSLVSDSAVLNMGADNDITITHVADVGLKLKQAGATGDGSPFVLTLQTGELDIAAADVLGQIDFQAPDEATGTDAILVAAGIAAISEGDFSSSSNATKLSFKTAASAAAAETMSLSSVGNLAISGDLTVSGDDLFMATNTSGAILVADGTNYNPAVVSGDISIGTTGVAAIGAGVIVEADIADDAVATAKIADNAVTLAKMAGGTDGNIISFDASGNPVAIATGDDGEVLTSAGAGAPPAFEAAAGGGAWTEISQTTISGDPTYVEVTGLTTTYQTHVLVCTAILPGTDNINIRGELGDSGAYESGAVYYGLRIEQTSGGDTYDAGKFEGFESFYTMLNSQGSGAGEGFNAVIYIWGSDGISYPTVSATFAGSDKAAAGFVGSVFKGQVATVQAVTRFRMSPTSGTWAAGKYTLYGIKHS